MTHVRALTCKKEAKINILHHEPLTDWRHNSDLEGFIALSYTKKLALLLAQVYRCACVCTLALHLKFLIYKQQKHHEEAHV